MFLGELYFECLELNLFCEQIELAVVAHIVELLFVSGDFRLRIVDFFFFHTCLAAVFLNLLTEIFDTGAQTFDVVFQIFDFQGQFASDGLDSVDFAKDCLKFVERLQTLLH